MTTTPQKIQLLLDQHTESVARSFIEYLCIETTLTPRDLSTYWTNFKNKVQTKGNDQSIDKCVYIFSRGNKAGEMCGIQTKNQKKYCTKHSKSEVKPVIKKVVEKDLLDTISEEDDIELEEDIIDEIEEDEEDDDIEDDDD